MEGILPLWKEKGMTSFDCVFKVRKILNIKKVGHSGTLDPDVEGLLPIAVGRGTKVLEYMLEADKVYVGEITLGYETTTEDASGEIISRKEIASDAVSSSQIDEAMAGFIGKITQIPPYYSAVRVNGKHLYEYARAGIEVERPSREVEIYSFERTGELVYDADEKTYTFPFEVHCSKGTYIRTLAVDLGKKLEIPAHMKSLIRTQAGDFKASNAVTLSELRKAVEEDRLDEILLPISYALTEYPTYTLSPELFEAVRHGKVFLKTDFGRIDLPAVLEYKEQIIAIYQDHPSKDGLVKPLKMFRTEL